MGPELCIGLTAILSQGNGHTSPGHSSAEDSYQYRYKPRRLLHQAAIWNNAAVADLLLQHEADENARDHNVSHAMIMMCNLKPLHFGLPAVSVNQ